MKRLKPGQLCTINRKVYRVKARTLGCRGCSLNTILTCPNVVFQNSVYQNKKIDCVADSIILVQL